MYYGEMISLCVAALWTVAALASEVASKRMGVLVLNFWRMVLALLFSIVLMWTMTGQPLPLDAGWQAWAWLLASGMVGYFLGDWCLFNSYVVMGSRFGQLFMTLAPAFTAFFAWTMIGQTLSWHSLLAMAVTLAGIAVAVTDKRGTEDGKPLPPKVTVKEETLNSRQAIWLRGKSDIKKEEYDEFYKHLSHDFQEPFETIHWSVEGQTEFRALLYIPQKPIWDMFMPEQRPHGLQLYVRRVFITDTCEELLPHYLRFLRGVVDSADLPLNVSREMLQEARALTLIRKNITKKVLNISTILICCNMV